MKRSLKAVVVAVSMMMLVATSVSAQTDTGDGTVEAVVSGICMLDTPFSIDFGTYDVFSETDKDASGSIAYRCTKGVTTHKVHVAASPRAMAHDNTEISETLSFGLYSDTGRSAAFPTTFATGIAGTGTAGVGASGGYTVPIYGRIPAGEDVPAGAYSATVVVTVQW
jgi:spore coat protein U-like protein